MRLTAALPSLTVSFDGGRKVAGDELMIKSGDSEHSADSCDSHGDLMTTSADRAPFAYLHPTPSRKDADEIFRFVDSNNDGKLVQEELKPFFAQLGIRLTTKEQEALFKSMDMDNDTDERFDEVNEKIDKLTAKTDLVL